jgi:hypothetical protein
MIDHDDGGVDDLMRDGFGQYDEDQTFCNRTRALYRIFQFVNNIIDLKYAA